MRRVVFAMLVMVLLIGGAVQAASPTKISTGTSPYPWEKVELWASGLSNMQSGQEPIVKFSLPANSKVKSWFPADLFVKDGSSSSYNDYNFGDYGHLKSDKYFVLGYGKNWSRATKATPIILVHGAGDDMNRAWAHPWSIQTPATIDENGSTYTQDDDAGLLQYLTNRGYAVFAISYAHNQGNVLIQGQLLADAIQVVKSVTGASKVDVVAHSKGNMAAISYMSSMNNEYSSMSWMDDYRGDVRKYIAVASPFKGLDTMFRYYMGNMSTIDDTMNAALGFHNAYVYYAYRDYHRWDMSTQTAGNYFQGQTQLLWNWRNDSSHPIGFNSDSYTSGDWNETMYDLYDGGTSMYVESQGINTVMADSYGNRGTSNFIAKMNNKGLDPYIDLYVMYGTRQAINYLWGWYPVGEYADSSDGLLFVASATYTSGMTRRGAELKAIQGYNYNHVDIARTPTAMNWIVTQLN